MANEPPKSVTNWTLRVLMIGLFLAAVSLAAYMLIPGLREAVTP